MHRDQRSPKSVPKRLKAPSPGTLLGQLSAYPSAGIQQLVLLRRATLASACYWPRLCGLAGCEDLSPGTAVEVCDVHSARGEFGMGDKGAGRGSEREGSWKADC